MQPWVHAGRRQLSGLRREHLQQCAIERGAEHSLLNLQRPHAACIRLLCCSCVQPCNACPLYTVSPVQSTTISACQADLGFTGNSSPTCLDRACALKTHLCSRTHNVLSGPDGVQATICGAGYYKDVIGKHAQQCSHFALRAPLCLQFIKSCVDCCELCRQLALHHLPVQRALGARIDGHRSVRRLRGRQHRNVELRGLRNRYVRLSALTGVCVTLCYSFLCSCGT